MTKRTHRTITLTGRPPVKIEEAAWPMVASARDHEYDGEYDFQANENSRWFIGVRQHEDGRTLVYAKYSYDSNWQGRRDYSAARGVLLDLADDRSNGAICRSIAEVCADIAGCEHHGDDADRWPTLRDDCIADMPAEVL